MQSEGGENGALKMHLSSKQDPNCTHHLSAATLLIISAHNWQFAFELWLHFWSFFDPEKALWVTYVWYLLPKIWKVPWALKKACFSKAYKSFPNILAEKDFGGPLLWWLWWHLAGLATRTAYLPQPFGGVEGEKKWRWHIMTLGKDERPLTAIYHPHQQTISSAMQISCRIWHKT